MSIVPALLSRAEVLAALRIKKSKLHADIAAGKFPGPVKFGSRSYFIEAEVVAWIDQRLAERDVSAARKAQSTVAQVRHSKPDQN